jgi:hypothetical protein
MSDTPMDPTAGDRDDELQDSAGGPDPDAVEGEEISTGTDGVGGGNDSRSSLLEDTLGAGGDPDDVDRDL